MILLTRILSLAGGPYFDPSYGVTYSGNCDFESKAVSAYVEKIPNTEPWGQTGRSLSRTIPESCVWPTLLQTELPHPCLAGEGMR